MSEEIVPRKNAPRPDLDWLMIEGEWRAGIKPIKQLAREYNVHEKTIRDRATRYKWERDINERIKQRAQELTYNEMLMDDKADDNPRLIPASPKHSAILDPRSEEEDEIVEAIAWKHAGIVAKSKKRIDRLQGIVESMFEELAAQAMTAEQIQGIGELVAIIDSQDDMAPDPVRLQKQINAFKKTLHLGSRADIVKKLAESLKTLTGLERQAWGLSDNANGDSDIPKTPVELSNNDAARRVAFLLANAVRRKGDTNDPPIQQ